MQRGSLPPRITLPCPSYTALCPWDGTSVGTQRGVGQHAPVGVLGIRLQGHLRTFLEVVHPHGVGGEHSGVRAHLRPLQRLLRHTLAFGLGGCGEKGRVRAEVVSGDKDEDRGRDRDSRARAWRGGNRGRGRGRGRGRVGVAGTRNGAGAAAPPGRARGRGPAHGARSAARAGR